MKFQTVFYEKYENTQQIFDDFYRNQFKTTTQTVYKTAVQMIEELTDVVIENELVNWKDISVVLLAIMMVVYVRKVCIRIMS